MTLLEELTTYAELAQKPLSAGDGNGLADAMLTVSSAIARVGEILADAQEGLLQLEALKRVELQNRLGVNVSEARLKAEIARLTIHEAVAVKRAENLLGALRNRFRAAQSALRHLDAELKLR